MRPWDELSEESKDVNRQQADHIAVKLRAIRCRAELLADATEPPVTAFTAEEIEAMARMEHQRWCASKWLAGWRHGPRHDAKRVHDNLVPWEQLSEPLREYDRDPARQIPDLLQGVGEIVVRDTRRA